jgi:uncharacterized protein YcnI
MKWSETKNTSLKTQHGLSFEAAIVEIRQAEYSTRSPHQCDTNILDATPYVVYLLIVSGKDLLKQLEKTGWTIDRIKGSQRRRV